MDKKLISNQSHEINHIVKKYGIPEDVVKEVIEEVGVSRRKAYKALRELGYKIGKK